MRTRNVLRCRVRWLRPVSAVLGIIVVAFVTIIRAAEAPGGGEPPVFVDERADEKSRARHQTRQEILAEARGGDFAAVTQRVTAAVAARRTGRSLDVDLAEELASVSFNLDEVGEPEAAQRVSENAREVLARLQRGKKTEEVIWASLMEAALSERVQHDATQARAAYRRVLEVDPKNEAAREGLARLDLADAITAEKIKEQELLLAERELAGAPLAGGPAETRGSVPAAAAHP